MGAKMIFRIKNHYYKTAQYEPTIYRLNKEQTETIGMFRIPDKYISTPLFKHSNSINQQQLKVLFLLVVADYKRLGQKVRFSDVRPSYLMSKKQRVHNKDYFKLPIGLFSDVNKNQYNNKKRDYKLNKRHWLLNNNLPNKIVEIL